MDDEDKKKKRLDIVDIKLMLTLAGAGCIVVLFFLFIGKFSSVIIVVRKLFSALTPIIIGFVIAFLLNPLVNHLRKSLKSDFTKMFKKAKEASIAKAADALAVTLSVLLFLLVITALLWILIPQLYDSVQNLYNNFDTYVSNVENMVNKLIKNYPDLVSMVNNYMDDIEESIKQVLTDKLLPNMNNIVVAISSGVFGGLKMIMNFFIGIIAAIYILASKDKFSAQMKKIIYSLFDKKKGNSILSTIDYIDAVFSGFIGGKLLDSFIVGAICFIFCKLVNMPYAVLISVIVGVTNIIPFFGPFIGAIPSAVLVLVESPKMCIVFIIFVLVLQQVDGNIIGPLMVLGVPTFACIYTFMTRKLKDNLNKRGLENNTDYFVALRGFDENGEPIRGPKKKLESASNKRKRERQLQQLQQSKEFIDKVTRHDKKGDTEILKSEDKNKDN